MRVIGVEERRGPIFGALIDKHVDIPLTTFQRIYGRNLDLQIHGKGKQRSTFVLAIACRAMLSLLTQNGSSLLSFEDHSC